MFQKTEKKQSVRISQYKLNKEKNYKLSKQEKADKQAERDSKKHINFWKRLQISRKETIFNHQERNYFPRKFDYYIYCILMGNGLDGLPMAFRLAIDFSGGFYIILLIINTFILAMPIMYMEIFLGKYTRLTNSQMYRMAPIFFGYCVLSFVVDIIHAPFASSEIGIALILALKKFIDNNYMKDCPENSHHKCFNYEKEGKLPGNCTYDFGGVNCSDGHGIVRYVSAYYYWQNFLDFDGNYSFWQSAVANTITWIFIVLFCMLGMRFLGMFLKVAFFINLFFYTIIFIMALTTNGSARGLKNIIEFTLGNLNVNEASILGFFVTAKIGLMTPSGYMTYAAYTNIKHKGGPGSECLIIAMLNLVVCIYYIVIMHAIAGVLGTLMGLEPKQVVVPFAGIYYAMIPEFLTYRDCPPIFLVIFQISNWLLETSKRALYLHMIIMNFYDFFPKVVNYQAYVFMGSGLWCLIIGLVGSLRTFVTIIKPMILLVRVQYTQGFRLLIESLMVFYCYGVSRLNDDIHFFTGRRPIKYWRILWYIYPILLCIGLLIDLLWNANEKNLIIDRDVPDHWITQNLQYIGIGVCGFYAAIVFMSTFFYIVVGLRSSATIMSLMKPQFYWGPPEKDARVARKSFAPRRSIRSQPPKKKKQRFRPHSIKQLHERDAAEHVTRGRIFLDSVFFTNVKKSRVSSGTAVNTELNRVTRLQK